MQYNSEYSRFEENYWWAVKRREIIIKVLTKYKVKTKGLQIIDIGCGSGANLNYLKRFGEPVGLELNFDCAKRVHKYGKHVINADAGEILPFKDNQFSLVSAQDVLEHLPCPEGFLKEVWRISKPGGLVVLTVPAYKFLFNPIADEGHYKRYIAKELEREACSAGFKIRRLTYFNTFLFPFMFLQRIIQKQVYNKQTSLNKIFPKYPEKFPRLFGFIFGSEKYFLPRFNFAYGGSILCICEKEI